MPLTQIPRSNTMEPQCRPKTTGQPFIRVIVMGLPKVGKTSIVNRYLKQRWTKEYMATISECHHVQTDILVFSILDTNDFINYTTRNMAIKTSDAFVLVYAIDDEKSFEHITALRNEIVAVKGDNVALVVVGNKNDSECRAVNRVIADCVVTIDWETPHLEVSAASDNLEIAEVFKHLLSHQYFKVGIVNPSRNSLPDNRINNKNEKRKLRERANTAVRLLFRF